MPKRGERDAYIIIVTGDFSPCIQHERQSLPGERQKENTLI